ncbi:MAG: DUF3810 domain-containing protein [Candidatus Aminicenantes bacterium]|nr:DUF3810 domain-containing protein [Candidatus Aminicenantes bacterium]
MVKEKEVRKSIINWKTKAVWVGLGLLALLVRFLFALNPNLTESLYSRGIFQGIRFCLDYTVGLLPFPFLYILTLALILSPVWKIVKRIKKGKKIEEKIPWRTRILNGLLSLAALIGVIVFLFYFLWGFNYQRLPIETQLHIKTEPLDSEAVRKEAHIAFQIAAAVRESIPGASEKPLDSRFIPEGLEYKIRDDLKKVLKSLGYPVTGRVRARRVQPSGLLMSFGAGGIYFPFTGEVYLPANLSAVETPFTMAHEMAHGFGFTEEGTANFLAYLACISSKDPLTRYSGCYVYFRYISSELFRLSEDDFRSMMEKLPREIMADMQAVSGNWARYRGWLMDIGEQVNDIYLKSQGIKEGAKSYNRLIVLTVAYRNSRFKPALFDDLPVPPIGE